MSLLPLDDISDMGDLQMLQRSLKELSLEKVWKLLSNKAVDNLLSLLQFMTINGLCEFYCVLQAAAFF